MLAAGPKADAVIHGRDADAATHVAASRGRMLPLFGPVGLRDGLVDRLGKAARLVDHLSGDGLRSEFQTVAAPDLDGVDLQLVGDLVDEGLARENDLGRAEAAVGAARHLIGRHREGFDENVVADIGPEGVNRSAPEDDRAERREGAAVDVIFYICSDNFSIDVGADLHLDQRWMTFGAGDNIFFALVDEFHGTFEQVRDHRCVTGEDRGEVLLASEAAAGRGLNDAYLVSLAAENIGNCVVDVEGALHRAVDGHRAFDAGHGDHALGFEVGVLLVWGFVLAFEDVDGFREGGFEVAVPDDVSAEDIVVFI
ncbi:MAG: hypothetical protein BWY66_01642 [bacterium ADurb.Bin374]|nr:MAG: hypothetical protein BWY66_01642 [bacterium ADurb.Bin374]